MKFFTSLRTITANKWHIPLSGIMLQLSELLFEDHSSLRAATVSLLCLFTLRLHSALLLVHLAWLANGFYFHPMLLLELLKFLV